MTNKKQRRFSKIPQAHKDTVKKLIVSTGVDWGKVTVAALRRVK